MTICFAELMLQQRRRAIATIVQKVKYHRTILPLLLGMHAVLLAYNGWWMSPTLDEPAHVVAGISHWQRADFSLYRVNPPLVRLVAAVPVLLVGQDYQLPERLNGVTDRNEFRLGEAWMEQNGRRTLWLVALARWACIPFSLLGAITCFWWARDLFGQSAGIAAAALWCFSPMVLGHASLLTPDVPAAALGLLACYSFWLWLQQPTWHRTIVNGLILGVAELSKTTLVLFYPLWPVMWLLYRWQDRATMNARRWSSEGLMLLARMFIGLYVINLGYLGTGSFLPLKEYYFRSELFADAGEQATGGKRFKESWLGTVPVPLPYDYLLGIDHQQRDFENFWGPSYLRGQFQETGWWYYYLYGILVKAPIGTLALVVLAGVAWWQRSGGRTTWQDNCILLMPAIFVFAVASSKTGFSHHLRYIFPCIPLIYVWLSQLFSVTDRSPIVADRSADRLPIVVDRSADRSRSVADSSTDQSRTHPNPSVQQATRPTIDGVILDTASSKRRLSPIQICAVVCLIATIASSLSRYPHSLAYFNELAGGPKRGPEHLLNSNVDWGQDLLYLERWIQRYSGGKTVYLAFDNNGNPFGLEIPNLESWPFRRVEQSDAGGAGSTTDLSNATRTDELSNQQSSQQQSSQQQSAQQPSEGLVTIPVPDGYYAISVNQLYEFPRWITHRDGSKYYIDTRPLKALRAMPPVGWAGYSIRIYTPEQLRTAYRSVGDILNP